MSDALLAGRRLAELRAAELTYREVGATRGPLPPGYRHLHRRVTIGTGLPRFEEAVGALMRWEMHRRAGVRVRPSSRTVTADAVALQRLGVGRAAIAAPVRVVYVVAEPRRRGFAYGTLPGHPASGEESFVVELRDDDSVLFTITAFSRPSWWIVRVSEPFVRLVQRWVTNRYLRALQASAG